MGKKDTCRYCGTKENIKNRAGIGEICGPCYQPIIDRKYNKYGDKVCLDCGVTGVNNFKTGQSLRCLKCTELSSHHKSCLKCKSFGVSVRLRIGIGYLCEECNVVEQNRLESARDLLIEKRRKTCTLCGVTTTKTHEKTILFKRNKTICRSCQEKEVIILKNIHKPCTNCGETRSDKFTGKKRYCNTCVIEIPKKKYAKVKNPEEYKTQARERYKNSDEAKAAVKNQTRKWQKDNPIRYKLHMCKSRAKQKGFGFDLDLEFIENLFIEQKNTCYYSGVHINENSFSIDRVNCDHGYVKDNVILCCSDANIARNNLTQEEFLMLIEKIYNHSILNKKKSEISE